MKKRNRLPPHLPELLLVCAAASLALPFPAAAYIDPGTGSMVLQVLIAGVLGAAFALKRFWKRIIASLRSAFKRP